ncbi:MAG TPA: NAD(+) diphosphatase [Streptosporangiaceae bacterium]
MTGHPDRPGAAPLPGLKPLALARSAIDRAAEQRTDPDWLARVRAGPGTKVLVIDDGKTLVRFGRHGASLVLLPAAQTPADAEFFLGLDRDGCAYFTVMAPLPDPAGLAEDGPGEVRPAGLREVGALLDDRDAGLFTHAVALANWHATHPRCPRCGALTTVATGGHSRLCPVDGSEHFPRTDPAMITLVTDAGDRALLARNSRWPERRVSILAGFVEPGESAEQAVVREVAEETGIVVDEVRYLGSQPWPMPQSLMLGFWARASGDQPIRVDAEEIVEAHWFSRDDLREAMASGQIRLPPPVSIAHRIIEAWYGEDLPALW